MIIPQTLFGVDHIEAALQQGWKSFQLVVSSCLFFFYIKMDILIVLLMFLLWSVAPV